MNAGPSLTAIVLAGARSDKSDPIAAAAGQPLKALVPAAGRPMLGRVLGSLRAAATLQQLVVLLPVPIMERPPAGLPPILQRHEAKGFPTAASPALSIIAAAERLKRYPLLVTTADHPLLTPQILRHFIEAADQTGADLVVALAEAETVRRAYPGALRTFYKLGGTGYCGCNLFMLRSAAGLKVPAFWAKLEPHRKKPWRLVAAIGLGPLLHYLFGRLDLSAAMAELSRLTGTKVAAVVLPQAEAAIDVDKPEDLKLAETILQARAGRN